MPTVVMVSVYFVLFINFNQNTSFHVGPLSTLHTGPAFLVSSGFSRICEVQRGEGMAQQYLLITYY